MRKNSAHHRLGILLIITVLFVGTNAPALADGRSEESQNPFLVAAVSTKAAERRAARLKKKTSPARSSASSSSNSSSVSGIIDVGLYLKKNGAMIYVGAVRPGSAAEQAGILPGDEIRMVNGLKARDRYSVAGLENLLDGPEGTSIDLQIVHEKGGMKDITLVRRPDISLAPFVFREEDDVTVLVLNSFSEQAAADLRKALQETDWKGTSGVVVDMRVNPSGTLKGLTDMLGSFLKAGTTFGILKFKNGRSEKIATSLTPVVPYTLPIVMLMNRGLTDPSSLFAYALAEKRRALIFADEEARGKNDVVTFECTKDDSQLLSVDTDTGDIPAYLYVASNFTVFKQAMKGEDTALVRALDEIRRAARK